MQVLSSGVLLYAMYFVPDWMFFCLPRIISVGRAVDCAVKDRALRAGLLLGVCLCTAKRLDLPLAGVPVSRSLKKLFSSLWHSWVDNQSFVCCGNVVMFTHNT